MVYRFQTSRKRIQKKSQKIYMRLCSEMFFFSCYHKTFGVMASTTLVVHKLKLTV